MKVIIAGSRTITHYETVQDAVLDAFVEHPNLEIDEVVSGGAEGVDRLGERFAKEMDIPIRYFYPDWKTHGKAAGPIRNGQMAAYADALVAVTTGSAGTADMIRQAERAGLLVYVKTVGS